MRNTSFFLATILFILLVIDLEAQITPNRVDSMGLKQGMWREFKVPVNIVTEKIGVKIPKVTSNYYYLTKDEDRKYFPIIECVGEYKNGLKVGYWEEFYGDGDLKSRIEYKDGVPTGKCSFFYGNGALKEEFTLISSDSIPVLLYETDGNFIEEKIVPKIDIIKAIYEN